jgi:serine protease inhibitor
MAIKVKKMSLDTYQVPVPAGLSELLDRGGVWSTDDMPLPPNYRREVRKTGNGLVTELTYVGDAS